MLMIKKDQNGSVHLVLTAIIAIALVALVGVFVFNRNDKKDSSKSGSSKISSGEENITLSNIGLENISDLEVTSNALREYESQGLKGYYNFGESLSGGRINPTFEFASMKKDANVVSAINGIVAFVKEQPETNDYEVFIQPKEGSIWTVGYDHISNIKVTKGQKINAGDVIGNPSIQNNGLYRFEIQVNKDTEDKTEHICPTTLLDANVKTALVSSLSSMQEEWNTLSGKTIYSLSAQKPIGCQAYTVLTPTQAEGR